MFKKDLEVVYFSSNTWICMFFSYLAITVYKEYKEKELFFHLRTSVLIILLAVYFCFPQMQAKSSKSFCTIDVVSFL